MLNLTSIIRSTNLSGMFFRKPYVAEGSAEGIPQRNKGLVKDYRWFFPGRIGFQGRFIYLFTSKVSFLEWKATAIGKNFVNAKTFLEKRYNEEMELEDAIHVALLTLKESFEGEMNEENIEIGIIGDQTNRQFKQLTPSEIKDYLDEAL